MRETDDGPETYHRGQQLCGLVWTCPYCGPHIRRGRAEEIDRACTVWQEAYGVGSMMLLTLTVPHDAGDTLARTLGAVREARAKMFSGRAWQRVKERYQIPDKISAHDCTHGKHGWHPHLHVILFCTRRLGARSLERLEAQLHQSWADLVEMRGLRRPTRANGTNLKRARDVRDLARYVAKAAGVDDAHALGKELARSDLKAGTRVGRRTPLQILADFSRTGDADDLALWHEWERETRGVRAICWSRGLRQRIELLDSSDQQLVEAEPEDGGVLLVTYSHREWCRIINTPDAEEHVLQLACEQGAEAVCSFLATLATRPPRRRNV